MHSRISHVMLLGILAISLAVCAQNGRPGAWSQSPVSPLPAPTRVSPTIESMTQPTTSPLPAPMQAPPALFTTSFWSSPWVWVVVGLILFGGMAWGTVRLLHRLGSQEIREP